jgi:iron complex outermembrane recepter protein
MLRLLTLLANLLLLTFSLTAQQTLSGSVYEHGSGQPIEFAQVALMSQPDTNFISGGITDINGIFRFQTAKTGEFLLRVSFVGYHEKWKVVTISRGKNQLGAITLGPAAIEIGGVEVTAAASLFKTEADRKLYNVENMTISDGGTASQQSKL